MKTLAKATVIALVNVALRTVLGVIAGCGLAAFVRSVYGGLGRLIDGGPGLAPIDAGLEVGVSWSPAGWRLGAIGMLVWSVVVICIHIVSAVRSPSNQQS
jgi:hypothetical protein